MQKPLLDHYLSFSTFTYPGLYQERLLRDLPTDISQAGRLVREQLIHKLSLHTGRMSPNVDDVVSKVPWYRQGEDDCFPTVAAMLAELYHRDPRGFVLDRAAEDKLILTCRTVATLMASILKSRGIPARVRTGYAPYIRPDKLEEHWIVQYWHASSERWIAIDADTSLRDHPFDPFDLPTDAFYFAADAWFALRTSRKSENPSYLYSSAYHVLCDFHCLMNNEILYVHTPVFITPDFDHNAQQKLQEIDALASLMRQPDENFVSLQEIWETNHDFRLLRGPGIGRMGARQYLAKNIG
ncbi:MAG TPA: transglutaminase domain-containing protein [Ktedonobacteraceae bacterium]|nr:transglutaminase domain-containing protein [Ktedonobacteraceae bacterium]